MKTPGIVLFAVSLLSPLNQIESTLRPDPPIACSDCDAWNQPHEPFRVFGNTYYVGTAGLSAVLVTSDAGSILLDGALPQSAALIDANIRKLGFRTEDIRLIVNSHEHYDHAGGIAAIQRFSGAEVAASAAAARALEQGEPTPDDPQYGFGRTANAFPAIRRVRVIADGEAVRVGNVAVTAHFTPGHTPGSTTWTWQSCEGSRCLNVVYADSLTAVAAPGFRFTPTADSFRATIAKVERLPCDILLSTHPVATGMAGKLARWKAEPASDAFIDANACRAYAQGARARLEERIAEEKKGRL
jgi:metallo-beta-lactamase class B